jgi:methanogenic corrinoid protein MtbC1
VKRNACVISQFLVRHGYRLCYLGPSLGAAGLSGTLLRHQPDLLIVSATSERTADRIDELAQVVNALPEPRPALAFGGRGFDDELRRQRVAGTYLGPDAGTAVLIVGRLLGPHTGDPPA